MVFRTSAPVQMLTWQLRFANATNVRFVLQCLPQTNFHRSSCKPPSHYWLPSSANATTATKRRNRTHFHTHNQFFTRVFQPQPTTGMTTTRRWYGRLTVTAPKPRIGIGRTKNATRFSRSMAPHKKGAKGKWKMHKNRHETEIKFYAHSQRRDPGRAGATQMVPHVRCAGGTWMWRHVDEHFHIYGMNFYFYHLPT